MQPAITPQSGRSSAFASVVPGMAQAIIALDYAVMFVALPVITAQLHLSTAEAGGIMAVYGLCFAAFLLAGGAICDRMGARLTFSMAMGLFMLASVPGALAHQPAAPESLPLSPVSRLLLARQARGPRRSRRRCRHLWERGA